MHGMKINHAEAAPRKPRFPEVANGAVIGVDGPGQGRGNDDRGGQIPLKIRLLHEGVDIVEVNHPEMAFNDFVVQMEIDVSDLGTGGTSEFNFNWREGDNGKMALSLTRRGTWTVSYCDTNDCKALDSGNINTYPYDQVSITLIAQSMEYMLFINETPLTICVL